MNIEFTKMHGLGNDFIIIDNRQYALSLDQLQVLAKKICTRRLSIGSDGLMALENTDGHSDFRMRFFNSDGSIGEMCGNGARCITRYAYINGIAGKLMTFETTAGMVTGEVIKDRMVGVLLNLPELVELKKLVSVNQIDYLISYIELGNPGLPHVVLEYKGLKTTDNRNLIELSTALRYHETFSKGANINFYELEEDLTVTVKTYERGVEDFTLACGTGSACVALTLFLRKEIEKDLIRINVLGGSLDVAIRMNNGKVEQLQLIGDTNIIAKGIIMDEDLKFYISGGRNENIY
ncbi:MAG: Diaminopimelate epimerase [Clostridiales bacterium 38_11]|nr:MAG: Diaminopimelate epimerase [Clostridiales bacterium 38_11]HBH11773.1 diaminopimelate epimerase [Clostridiales bacterium]